jgi:DNA-binding PadR family transcriptional regulator
VGEFEQLVLLALVRLGAGAYGMEVRREIEERTGRDVSIAAVYTTLGRIEAKGWAAHELGEPTPERGGRAKKHYRPLPEGLAALAETRSALDSMWDGLSPGRSADSGGGRA